MISRTKRHTGSIRDGEPIFIINSYRMRTPIDVIHIVKSKNENGVSIPNTIIRYSDVSNNTYVCDFVHCECK